MFSVTCDGGACAGYVDMHRSVSCQVPMKVWFANRGRGENPDRTGPDRTGPTGSEIAIINVERLSAS